MQWNFENLKGSVGLRFDTHGSVFDLLQHGQEEAGMKLLDVEFGLFAVADPDDGATFFVDFEHVPGGLFLTEVKDFSKDCYNVTHQVHGVIMHDNLPGIVAKRSFSIL